MRQRHSVDGSTLNKPATSSVVISGTNPMLDSSDAVLLRFLVTLLLLRWAHRRHAAGRPPALRWSGLL
ncbi:MAG: hypothetical protein WCG47_01770, partial [Dermatophilaceae bacterium]